MVAMIRVSAILISRCRFSNVKPTLSDHSGRTSYRIRNWRRSLDNQRCHLQRHKTRRNLRSSETNPRKSRFSFWDTLERSVYMSQDEPNELTVTIANSRQLIPVQTEVTISLQTLFFDQFCLAQAETFELQAGNQQLTIKSE